MKISHFVFFFLVCSASSTRNESGLSSFISKARLLKNLIPLIRRLRGGDLHNSLSSVEKIIGKDFVYSIMKDFTEEDLKNLDTSSVLSLATDSKDAGYRFWSLVFDSWDKTKSFFIRIINEILSKEGSTVILRNLFASIPREFRGQVVKSLKEHQFSKLLDCIYEDEPFYRMILDEIYLENDVETFFEFFHKRNQTIESSRLLSNYPNFIPKPFVHHLEQESIKVIAEEVEQLVPILDEKIKNSFGECTQLIESEILKIKMFLSVLSPQNLYEFLFVVFNGEIADPFSYKKHLLVSLVDWKRCWQWKTEETWRFLQLFCHNGFILTCDKVSPLLECISKVPVQKLSEEQKEMLSFCLIHSKWRLK